MKNSSLKFVLVAFLIWRIGILFFAFLAVRFVPLFGNNYLGGGFSNYTNNPLFWGHLNFDGEHYLAIAQNGYKPLEYFFFPFFPYLIRFLSLNRDLFSISLLGLVISNLSFFVALLGIYKLIKLDFKENIARLAVILFLVFPTSFYFGAFYNESVFLALIIWSFLFARKGNFLFAGLAAMLASATRIIGVVMFPVLILEFLSQKRKNFLPILISPLGLITYMYYLLKQTGDPLVFLHQVSVFGQQRSSVLIFLPQVFYRYFFKIIPSLTYSYFPVVFTTYLELGISIIFLILIFFCFWKLRLSYCLYALFAYLIPTLAGSFSSMPRYVLVIFPVFILITILIERIPTFFKYLIFSVMILMLVVATMMFFRGYWVA